VIILNNRTVCGKVNQASVFSLCLTIGKNIVIGFSVNQFERNKRVSLELMLFYWRVFLG